jgi:hypothetical protein
VVEVQLARDEQDRCTVEAQAAVPREQVVE